MLLRERDLFTRFVRARPLMTATLLFLLGCALQYALEFPRTALITAALVPAIAGLCLRKRNRLLLAPLLILSMLPLGALRFDFAWQAVAPLPEQNGVQIEGLIVETPFWNAETQRSICVLDELVMDGSATSGRIRLYLC